MNIDHVNAIFEGGGSLLTWLNIRQLLRGRTVRGVHWLPLSFWTAWGFWNIWYYSHLIQWFSFFAGLGVVLGNCVNLFLMWRFWPRAALIDPNPLPWQKSPAKEPPSSNESLRRAREAIAEIGKPRWKPDSHFRSVFAAQCPVENCRICVPHSHTQALINRIKNQ